jgi:peptide/nickel transport system substrate-binding protein
MSVCARRHHGRLAATSAGIAVAALLIGACSGSSSPSSSGKSGTAVSGGVATFALPAGAVPDWIFPFIDSAHSSVDNRNQFDYLMYRPLYFFGDNGEPVMNPSLSLADSPVYSNNDQTVTIKLKNYKWSNGEAVTAEDVVFWLNMMSSEKKHWAYYVPGGLPDNLSSYQATDASTVVLNLKTAYNPEYFTDNELSQITPMPMAWDMTSATTKGSCATTVSSCPAVWSYLYSLAEQTSTYASSPIWQTVDGPWHLTSYQATGYSVFKPNPKYSGPVKAKLSEFVEEPFTTEQAELNVLRSGGISVGYIPVTDIAQKQVIAGSGYTLNAWLDAGINYFPYNFNNPAVGAIFKQLYIRQAFQRLINQPQYITQIFGGYASPTYGPVPNAPANPYIDSYVKNNPYPFSVSAAKQLLTSHGWNVQANGVTTCTSPGAGASNCGSGIAAGAKLSFNLLYASGSTELTAEMEAMKSTFSEVGIDLNLSEAPFDTVISSSVPCQPTQASCSWQLDNWGGGWSYSMDHLPNGDLIFGSGAGDNFGSYNDPTADNLIAQTYHQTGTLDTDENYLAQNLPAIFMPKADYQLTEVSTKLQGVTPQEPTFNITPEEWYFTK